MTLRNALEGLALNSTLQALVDLFTTRGSAGGDAHLVSGTKLRYRREFTDPALSAFDVAAAPGMVVTAGSGVLTVATGTTPGEVTTLVTKQRFHPPFRANFGVKLSQKIANQEFYVEAVAVNADGSLDETAVAAWRIAGTDSTTTTVARVETRNGAAARFQSANITVNSQTADSVYELIVESHQVQFHNWPMDSTSSRTGSTIRNSVAPDPEREYALRFRVVNGAVAPASSTTFSSSFVTATDYTEILAGITGGPGQSVASQSVPVLITGGSVALSNGTIGASSSTTGTTIAKVLAAASINATLVKSSAARVYGYHLANTSAAWRFVRFYNSSTAPAAGASPAYILPIPPGGTIDLAHMVPISHATGLAYAITAGGADNDATVVAAGDVVGAIYYA